MIISSIAGMASIIGDPARANMLFALKDDGCISAGDLSIIAGVAPSTASEHLAKMVEAGLVTVAARGRKRFYNLAAPEVADILDGLESVATTLWADKIRQTPQYEANLHARSCYDHLAGRVGVRLAVAMIENGFIKHTSTEPELTRDGLACLASFNIDADIVRAEPRRFLRLCPDWTERSVHVGGAVGAALLRGMINFDWLRRMRGSDKVVITPKGVSGIRSRFGLEIGIT
jgi:DNA-binding transcriptional ArsR family regulator